MLNFPDVQLTVTDEACTLTSNVPLTTVLLTHGAAAIFLLWYVMPRDFFPASLPLAAELSSAPPAVALASE